MSGRGELVMQGRLFGLSGHDAKVRAQELLEAMDLADAGDRAIDDRRGRRAPGRFQKRHHQLETQDLLVELPGLVLGLDSELPPQDSHALLILLKG